MNKTTCIPFLILVTLFLTSSCREDQQPVPAKDSAKSVEDISVTAARITDEKITITTADYAARVNTAFSTRTPLTIPTVFALGDAMQPGPASTATKLITQQKQKFTGTDQQGTRRPQGIANYGDYVINSWYFTGSSQWDGNLKFTIANRSLGKYFNVVPVRFHSSDSSVFQKIESHAGGLTVIGHYLYATDNETKSIAVFDLNKIYKIVKPNDPNVNSGANFIYEYTYMMPQVGHINLKFGLFSQGKASYMSLTQLNSQDHFVIGNFTETNSGGHKSMIWLLPVQTTGSSFPSVQTNASHQYPQLEPRFPSASGLGSSIDQIQGAVVKDNVLILSRSWQDDMRQLIVMEFVNILADTPVLTQYFNGSSASNPHNHEIKNWWTGCEDLEYYNGRIYTVTEWDDDNRSIYSSSYSDILYLMD